MITLPEYHKYYVMILHELEDGEVHEFDEIKELVSKQVFIAKSSSFKYCFGRACGDLTRAEFITKSKSKQLAITDAGLKALAEEDKNDPVYWSMRVAYATIESTSKQLEELDEKYGKLNI